MRKFLHDFWQTLTTPEEWHTASIVIVGFFFLWALSETLGRALDLLY